MWLSSLLFHDTRISVVIVCGLLVGPWVGMCEAQSVVRRDRLPHDDLMAFCDVRGETQRVMSVADWEKRRKEIVRGVEQIMGTLPGDEKRIPFELTVIEEVDAGSYLRRLILYSSEPGCRVPAYLLIPKNLLAGGQRAPALLCLHGTDHTVGHGTVVGLGSKPNRAYAAELADRGYVVLAPSYPLLAKYQPDIEALGWESGTLKAVWDNLRGIDLLASFDYVDTAHGFGAIGHSLGGHNSVYTALFDSRIRVIVSSCGLDSFVDYYDGAEKNWYPEKGWCQKRYMPKLAEYRGRLKEIPFDFHELIGCLAPRAILIIAPTRDSNFRASSVDRIARAALPVFELYGQADQLKVEHPDAEHDFPVEMRQAAYAWIDRVLRP